MGISREACSGLRESERTKVRPQMILCTCLLHPQAKLGNSSVSPNVGHLILKYLCPAVQAVLEDGLKAFVLDVIIGQRKNMPWSVVEASTQLGKCWVARRGLQAEIRVPETGRVTANSGFLSGPSTKVLHGLYNKVSQFPELTSHTMRFNAFILGLLK